MGGNTNLMVAKSKKMYITDEYGADKYEALTELHVYDINYTLFYKMYLARDAESGVYLLFGAGIGYYELTIKNNVYEAGETYDDSAPLSDQIDKSYKGDTVGYHALIEFGWEGSVATCYTGIKARYGVIDELKSDDGSVMTHEDGSDVEANLTSWMWYFGAGIHF